MERTLSNATDTLNKIVLFGMESAPKAILAVLTLIAGWFFINGGLKVFDRTLDRRKVDPTLHPFLRGVVSVSARVALLISVAGMVGIETTSFIAMLGSAGLAVGLALQGSMSNFAGGVLLLVLKPFKVGDLIEAQGFVGSVKEIGVLNTILKTADNRTIILPNSPLAGSAIVNYSTESTRRIDLVFRIDYADSIRRARETIHRLIDKEDRILSKPAPVVVVSELGDSAVNLTLRIWCRSEDFGALQFDIREGVKDAFDREKITVPVPQRQVRILPGNEAAAG